MNDRRDEILSGRQTLKETGAETGDRNGEDERRSRVASRSGPRERTKMLATICYHRVDSFSNFSRGGKGRKEGRKEGRATRLCRRLINFSPGSLPGHFPELSSFDTRTPPRFTPKNVRILYQNVDGGNMLRVILGRKSCDLLRWRPNIGDFRFDHFLGYIQLR